MGKRVFILITFIILVTIISIGCKENSENTVKTNEDLKLTEEEMLKIIEKDANEAFEDVEEVKIIGTYRGYVALAEIKSKYDIYDNRFYNFKTDEKLVVCNDLCHVESCEFINENYFILSLTGVSIECHSIKPQYKKHCRIGLDEEGKHEIIDNNEELWFPLNESISFGEGYVEYELTDIRVTFNGLQLEFNRDDAYLNFVPGVITRYVDDKFIIELDNTSVFDKDKIYNLINLNTSIKGIEIIEENNITKIELSLEDRIKVYKANSNTVVEFEFEYND